MADKLCYTATTKMIQFTVNQFEWMDTGKVEYQDILKFWREMLQQFPEAYDEDWYPIIALDVKQQMVDWLWVADAVNRLLGHIPNEG